MGSIKKLKRDVRCPLCGEPAAAVQRYWGPITRFEYYHSKPPYPLHTTAMPEEVGRKIAKEETEEVIILGCLPDSTLIPSTESDTGSEDDGDAR